MGCNSIPISRSINPVDAVEFTGFSQNSTQKPCVLDADGREIHAEMSFGREGKCLEADRRLSGFGVSQERPAPRHFSSNED
jgi:hypothetical protein